MVVNRDSDIQKKILSILFMAFRKDIKQVKSTELNQVVNNRIGRDILPVNFRASCKTLEKRGLIMREKINLDWYVNITPSGLDFVFAEMDKQEQKK